MLQRFPKFRTATSEILGVIASSPTEIQPVLDSFAENAPTSVMRPTQLLARGWVRTQMRPNTARFLQS